MQLTSDGQIYELSSRDDPPVLKDVSVTVRSALYTHGGVFALMQVTELQHRWLCESEICLLHM